MSDNKQACGGTGIVWKMVKKKVVENRPARHVCTVAACTGPAAVEGRIRAGDKLVAVFRPPPLADGGEPQALGADTGVSPSKAQRAVRICVVDCNLLQVRQLLEGKAGESVLLEFLRAAEYCPSEDALASCTFGRPRNTFSVRLVREPLIDFSCVQRSSTVGVKPIADLYAERKLEAELDQAYKAQAAMLEKKKQRKGKRYQDKIARHDQVTCALQWTRLHHTRQFDLSAHLSSAYVL